MSKRSNKALWDYLERSGALDTGSDDAIKAAKRAYRKQYLLDFKRKQRSKKPEFSINFSKTNGDYDRIAQAATKHKMSISGFVRSAALAYLDRKFLVPNIQQIARLEQILSDCLNEVKRIVHSKEKFFWEREQKVDAIEKRIEQMGNHIDEVFRRPPLIEQ